MDNKQLNIKANERKQKNRAVKDCWLGVVYIWHTHHKNRRPHSERRETCNHLHTHTHYFSFKLGAHDAKNREEEIDECV